MRAYGFVITAKLVLAFSPVLAAPFDAAEARYTPAYDRCLESGEAGRGVTSAMVACIAAEHAVQDRALNRTYQRVLSGRAAPQAARIRSAQRAWIAYRDARCDSENQTGGTIDAVGRIGCVLHETARRNIELEAMLAGEASR